MEPQHDHVCRSILEKLIRKNETLAIAESCSGGLISEWLTRISGSSKVFKGGVVAYADEVKTRILGVDEKLIQNFGAVSSDVAVAMANQTVRVFNTDWAISVTGVAGPTGGSPSKPVGTVFIGLASTLHCESRKCFFANETRQNVRERSAIYALKWLDESL